MTQAEYLALSSRLDRIEEIAKALLEFHATLTEQETSRALEKVRKLTESKSNDRSRAKPS